MQERKLVTALFCDLVGSTSFGEQLDAEALQSVQTAYFDRMRSVVERFGGTLEKFIGDAVVAVFGVPQLHEDDAERAVRCGLAMRAALAGLNDSLRPRLGVELEIRIGIATDEAVVGDGDAIATGDVMNTAARLEQAAAAGETLVSRETALLSRAAIEYGPPKDLDLRGKREPVEASAALRVAPSRRRARASLVGRGHELEVLARALEAAIRDAASRVVVVLGEPGIGKSRLADEFEGRAVGRAAVLRGACVPYGEGATWLPLAQVVQGEARILDGDPPQRARAKLGARLARRHPEDEARVVSAQLGPLVGATRDPVASGPELLWAIRRYLEALAGESPVAVVLDDLHWASETLLDLLHELVETIARVPLLLVCQGRPELREQLAEVMAAEHTRTLELGGLTADETNALAASLGLDANAADRAEGNPLFVEELAALTSQERATATIPRSLRALIAARIDLLPEEAKRAVQTGAVVGDVFWDTALSGALGRPLTGSAARLLRTRGLVDEDASSAFLGSRQFRFHHALIREVAYASLSKQERSELHRQAAAWLEDRLSERPESTLTVAHHLDRALSLRAEIAPLESPVRELVGAAVSAQWRAGEWAETNAAMPDSLRLARRAVDLSKGSATLHEVSRARLARALVLTGRADEGTALAASVLASEPPDEARAYATLAFAQAARDRADLEGIRAHAEPALALARATGQLVLEMGALNVLSWADIAEGRLSDGEGRMARVVEICLGRGDLAGAGVATGVAGVHSMWRGALELAEERARDTLRYANDSGSLQAHGLAQGLFAHLRREQGRLEEAVEHGRKRLELELEVGDTFRAVGACALTLAQPLLLLDRLDEAWAVLEQARELADRIGASWFDDAIRGGRAAILRRRGKLDEAEAELEPDSEGATMLYEESAWAEELAKLRAAQGRDEEAERIWRELLERPAGENLLGKTRTRLQLAAFLAERGRADEAAELAAEARAAIEGRGAGLLESELAAVEALSVTA